MNSADNAKIVLNRLGIGTARTIVYLDVEGGYSSTCETPVGRYVGGFSWEMRQLGMRAGFYSSACAPDMDYFAGLQNPPDDAWIASYNGIDSANTSGSVSCVTSTNWVNHHRIHQWKQDQTVTWGGATVNVDFNCSDGDTDTIYLDLNLTCG